MKATSVTHTSPPHAGLLDDSLPEELRAGWPDNAGLTANLASGYQEDNKQYQVLIVDDEEEVRQLCRFVLEPIGVVCSEAADGNEALGIVQSQKIDVILLDMALPGMSGAELCRRLQQTPPIPHLKIIMFSGHLDSDGLAPMLDTGADDFITKPFSIIQLQARIKAALRLKEAQDRCDCLSHHLFRNNIWLKQNLHTRDRELVEAHQALTFALAKLVECRDTETGAHIHRMRAYCLRLAEEIAHDPAFAPYIDADFCRWLDWCAPLHDIGKAGIPDRILHKKGPLTSDERAVMKTHTILGAQTLMEVARRHGSGKGFLDMAIDIARHHHERFDGTGYPDQLIGIDIPLAARMLAIADVYDALRSSRVYKGPLSHEEAVKTMVHYSPGQFDPVLLQAFESAASDFDQIFLNQQGH